MDLGLPGKVAVVAGASRGLGKAVAFQLAAEGATLVLAARDQTTLEETASLIEKSFGNPVLPVVTDVTVEAEVNRLVGLAIKNFNQVDILIANAGGPPPSQFETTDVSQWQEGLQLNLLSTIYLCRAFVPLMRQRAQGKIVAITSVSVKQPVDGLILSNTARAGVVGMMKTLSNELAPHNVNVNVVCPGFTKTDRLVEIASRVSEQEDVSIDSIYKRWTDQIPMQRLGESSEFADVVAFLCSERASYVTGVCLQVDGGFVRSLL